MTRSKRFAYGLVSSYAAIAVNIVYTLASVPLALHYLDKEQFGIWALITQLAGYLMLLELGMTGSVARSLSDHKDDVTDGMYGSILQTGSRVFAIQGLAVLLIGSLLAWTLPSLLHLSKDIHGIFSILMLFQTLMSALRLGTGALASPLWCHQRLDLSNLATSITLGISFVALWGGFSLGMGLYSLALATALSSILSIILAWYFCKRLGLYPPKEHRGAYSSAIFKDLFNFGKDLFIMNLGAQLATASQVIVISRILGVETAAVWAIATKIYNMAQLLVQKIFDASAGGLAEMIVRGEFTVLLKRYKGIVQLSAVVAVSAGSGIVLMNGPFIEAWTSGKVTWTIWNNLILGCLLMTTGVTRCHASLVGVSKSIRGMKYVYLLEGLSFVVLSLFLGKTFGLTGILSAALVCNLLITGTYGIYRSASYFQISKSMVTSWVLRPFATILPAFALFLLFSIQAIAKLDPSTRLVISATSYMVVIVPALWFGSLDASLRKSARDIVVKLFTHVRLRPKAS